MTWTYDPAQLATMPTFQVRLLIGDTLTKDPQFQDEELAFLLTLRRGIYGAAAEACRSLAAQLSRKADTVQGEMRTLYSSQAKAYAARAVQLENRAVAGGAGVPYAGGISVADKTRQQLDGDQVAPQFNIGMDDNLAVPVGPVGNEQPSAPTEAPE